MSEKTSKTLQIPFKDENLPKDDLSIERALEIEQKVMPLLNEELEKFLKKNPEFDKRKG